MTRQALLLALIGLMGAAPATKSPTTRPARPLLIRNGTLFDGTGAPARLNPGIYIEHGRIVALAEPKSLRDDIEILDATDCAILPGLIDLHVHLGAPAGDDVKRNAAIAMADYFRNRPGVRADLLRAGVTTIRTVGDPSDWILNIKRQTAAGDMPGPRVFTTGPIFTAPGGHPAGTIYKGNQWLIDNATRQVTDPEIARAQVRKLADAGVDGIKCVYSKGYKSNVPQLSLECLRAIITEAHSRKLWVAVHAQNESEVRDALEAGADTIEHGDPRRVSEPTMALFKKPNVTLVPTVAVVESIFGPPASPPTKSTLLAVKAAHDAGVRIAVGTDTQGPKMGFGTSVHREMELLVEAGLTPTEALVAATRDAAVALGKRDEFGTIEQGKLADLIFVKGEPWKRIGDVREVRVVVQHGHIAADQRKPAKVESLPGRP